MNTKQRLDEIVGEGKKIAEEYFERHMDRVNTYLDNREDMEGILEEELADKLVMEKSLLFLFDYDSNLVNAVIQETFSKVFESHSDGSEKIISPNTNIVNMNGKRLM